MKKLLLLTIAIFSFLAGDAQSVTRLIGSSPFQDSLWVFDTTNMAAIRRLGPTVAGFTVTGMNGLARHPISNEIYIICKLSGVTGRVLGKLNPVTGVITQVGNMGGDFTSLTFNSSGTLYATTGQHAVGTTAIETLYIIDINTGAATFLRTLGNGADGEVICFNSNDNMIYHWSGNSTVIFEKFDTAAGPIINIPITGTPGGETFGMVYLGGDYFMGSNISSNFRRWHASGAVSAQVGLGSPDDIRGTALITCPRLITGTAGYCVGDSTALTMNAGNGSTYQWFKNGVAVAGATASTYYASSVGSYNCFVSDACGSDSLAAAIVVSQFNLPVVAVSGNSNLCPSDSITLTASSGGTSQWYLNGAMIVGANTNTYTVTAPGVYNMTKTNLNGCTDSAAVGITVVAVPAPSIALGNDTAFCTGGSVVLDAQNAGAAYVWSDASTAQTLTASASGTYTVQVTDANGCIGTDAIDIVVNSLPAVALGTDTVQCAGTVVLDAQNSGSTYLWSDASTAQTLTVASTGTYTVQVTDANGCVGTDAIDVTINSLPIVDITTTPTLVCVYGSPIALVTSPAGGVITGTGVVGTSFDPQIAGAGMFFPYYTYTDVNGCVGTDSIQVDVDLCLGIATANSNEVSIYPNPVNDVLSVDLTGTNETVTFSIVDVAGKLVMNQTLVGGSVVKVDVASIDKGMYFVQLINNGKQLQQRLIVTH